MNNFFLTAKISLLSGLPLPVARKCFQRSIPDAAVKQEKQLLVDVSVIIRDDARTGIQRVVRALLLQLLKYSLVGYTVRPVFCTRKHGFYYANGNFLLDGEKIPTLNSTTKVTVASGDIFLGLDLTAHLLPLHKVELAHWKNLGVKIHVVMYDLLPVLRPQWFKPKTTRNFHRWLKTIAIFSNSIVCISNTVKVELENWLRQRYSLTCGTIPISVINLGADLQSTAPSRGLPDNVEQLLNRLGDKPMILMVGTVEPRKGHDQVLTGFEQLWSKGRDVNLVIVGKPGWKTESLQQRLREHSKDQIGLYWLDKASDELLDLLYTHCQGVIVASQAEGFGLPLIEAMYYNKPILARDIPVFREVGKNFVTFFSGTDIEGLMNEIELWLSTIETSSRSDSAPRYTWKDSADQLLDCLGISQLTLTAGCDLPLVVEAIA